MPLWQLVGKHFIGRNLFYQPVVAVLLDYWCCLAGGLLIYSSVVLLIFCSLFLHTLCFDHSDDCENVDIKNTASRQMISIITNISVRLNGCREYLLRGSGWLPDLVLLYSNIKNSGFTEQFDRMMKNFVAD